MQSVQIIHNPGAGDGDISKPELINLVEAAGYSCHYLSTKKEGWKDFELGKTDLIMVAGGDGTIRKVCKQLLRKKYRENPVPVAVVPLGTANNLGKTLKLEMDTRRLVGLLPEARVQRFGIGKLQHLSGETFFMESFGYGVFPYLMMEMKKRQATENSRAEEIKAALRLLHDLVLAYPPRHCRLQVGGKDHSGDYIMVEIMNIKSIGPNLIISPDANPSDNKFEVVMVSADQKEQFANYLQRTLNGDKATFEFVEFDGRDIEISWEGTHVHVDDKLIKLEANTTVSVSLEESVFQFLIPDSAGIDRRDSSVQVEESNSFDISREP